VKIVKRRLKRKRRKKKGDNKKENNDKKKISLKSFSKLSLIGKGAVGLVYLVRNLNTGKLCAMKSLNKEDMVKNNKVKRALTEREILATSCHPFIINLHYCFQSHKKLIFIMEYCAGGEFYKMIQRQPQKCLTEQHAKFYAAEVLAALEYLHSKGYIYRDLKPENILIHESGHIRLTDFDLSKSTQSLNTKVIKNIREKDLLSYSFVGTEEYLAPEVIDGVGHNSLVDWWTYGVLIYEMLYGKTPFKGKNRDVTFRNIRTGSFKLQPTRRGTLSKECKNLLKKLLHRDPKRRIGNQNGATEIKTHPFFKGINFQELIKLTPPFIPQLSDELDMKYFGQKKKTSFKKSDIDEEINTHELSKNHPFKDFKSIVAEGQQPTNELNVRKRTRTEGRIPRLVQSSSSDIHGPMDKTQSSGLSTSYEKVDLQTKSNKRRISSSDSHLIKNKSHLDLPQVFNFKSKKRKRRKK